MLVHHFLVFLSIFILSLLVNLNNHHPPTTLPQLTHLPSYLPSYLPTTIVIITPLSTLPLTLSLPAPPYSYPYPTWYYSPPHLALSLCIR